MVLIRVENFIAPFFLFSTIISEEGSNNDEYHQGRYKVGEYPSPSKEKKLGDSWPLILTTKQLFTQIEMSEILEVLDQPKILKQQLSITLISPVVLHPPIL